MVRSLYDVLQVDRTATLDEIKLAFKRRALHVHPDKGGSEEAFHLVYHAFETLADPEARTSYDQQAATPGSSNHKCRKKTATNRSQPSQPSQPSEPRNQPSSTARKAFTSYASHQTKLLIRLRDLLRELPRETRNDVIKQDFSQQQRLILEKWMVDVAETLPAESQALVPFRAPQAEDQSVASLELSRGSSMPVAKVSGKALTQQKGRKKTCSKKTARRSNRSCGAICRSTLFGRQVAYQARIRFDLVDIRTGLSDLQTALERLIILTSVKQKAQDPAKSSTCFEERLQEALLASAIEHGGDLAELNLRFAVFQFAGSCFGGNFIVRSPTVHSIQDLGKLRSFMTPFRQYSRHVGTGSMFWRYSPEHLQDAWQRFQIAIADMFAAVGTDSTGVLRRICASYQANSSALDRKLQVWERQHMALQDTVKHRPRGLRYNFVPPNRRKGADTALGAVKKLLGRWGLLLKRKAQLAQKERRKALQIRMRAQRRRLEELKRKRKQEEDEEEKWIASQDIVDVVMIMTVMTTTPRIVMTMTILHTTLTVKCFVTLTTCVYVMVLIWSCMS